MKAEFSLLTTSLALSCLKKTQNFRIKTSLLRTEDTQAFLKGDIHLYVEHQLEDTNTIGACSESHFVLWKKSSASDSLNSIYVPQTFGSGDLQAVNKDKKMKCGSGWNLGQLDLHVAPHLCKLLRATLLTLRVNRTSSRTRLFQQCVNK